MLNKMCVCTRVCMWVSVSAMSVKINAFKMSLWGISFSTINLIKYFKVLFFKCLMSITIKPEFYLAGGGKSIFMEAKLHFEVP